MGSNAPSSDWLQSILEPTLRPLETCLERACSTSWELWKRDKHRAIKERLQPIRWKSIRWKPVRWKSILGSRPRLGNMSCFRAIRMSVKLPMSAGNHGCLTKIQETFSDACCFRTCDHCDHMTSACQGSSCMMFNCAKSRGPTHCNTQERLGVRCSFVKLQLVAFICSERHVDTGLHLLLPTGKLGCMPGLVISLQAISSGDNWPASGFHVLSANDEGFMLPEATARMARAVFLSSRCTARTARLRGPQRATRMMVRG